MRVAGDSEIYHQLLQGRAVDGGLADAFIEAHALLRSKGYTEGAAQQLAQEMVQGKRPPMAMTSRFAGTQGLPLVSDT
jgi:hypothetical protein